jgi:hypothetical protein
MKIVSCDICGTTYGSMMAAVECYARCKEDGINSGSLELDGGNSFPTSRTHESTGTTSPEFYKKRLEKNLNS